MRPTVRHPGATLLAVLLLVTLACPVAAALPTFGPATAAQAEASLGSLVNAERVAQGLVALPIDPIVTAIARQRAETMAATDVLSHQNPDGSDVFAAIAGSGIPWFAAGEVIVWNNDPTEPESTAHAVAAWFGSPEHRAILLSTDFNYAGFGAAVSPVSGNRYYAGVLVRRTDRSAAWARAGVTSMHIIDPARVRVTVRWTGGDLRLQTLTAGLRNYEIQRRVVGGAWRSLGFRTGTSLTETLPRDRTYQFRIRGHDRAGNRGPWIMVIVKV